MRAHILNKDPRKRKFDPRSKIGIFLGYSDRPKAYRVWIPSERNVVVSRDVKVLENSYYKNISNNGNSDEDIASNKMSTICISNDEDTKSSDDDCLDVPTDERQELETDDEEVHEDLRKAPGRPKILRTGRRGYALILRRRRRTSAFI